MIIIDKPFEMTNEPMIEPMIEHKNAPMNEQKKELSKVLIEIMKTNEIDCVDIKDGQLCYVQQNVKKPITKKNLLTILSKYYKGDIEKATNITEYISSNREETVRESITRKIN